MHHNTTHVRNLRNKQLSFAMRFLLGNSAVWIPFFLNVISLILYRSNSIFTCVIKLRFHCLFFFNTEKLFISHTDLFCFYATAYRTVSVGIEVWFQKAHCDQNYSLEINLSPHIGHVRHCHSDFDQSVSLSLTIILKYHQTSDTTCPHTKHNRIRAGSSITQKETHSGRPNRSREVSNERANEHRRRLEENWMKNFRGELLQRLDGRCETCNREPSVESERPRATATPMRITQKTATLQWFTYTAKGEGARRPGDSIQVALRV